MRSVPQVFFGMTRLATLLLSLGPAKLVRHTRSFWVFFPLVEGVSPLLNALDYLGMTEEEKLSWITCRDQGLDQSASIFQRMDKSEMDAMFDRVGDQAKVKSWLKEGITWRVGDASAPELIHTLGTQDVVVANRFLCHMEPAAAERCLRNIASLVKPGGYIFVSGVDLDVRTKVAKELDWKPVPDSLREIHEGDFSLTEGWPLGWWGLEPFCEDRPDWRIRYASVFRVGETGLGIPRMFHGDDLKLRRPRRESCPGAPECAERHPYLSWDADSQCETTFGRRRHLFVY